MDFYDYMDMDPEVIAGVSVGIMFLALAAIIPMIFYLLTLQKTLAAVRESNRDMPPGQVWMMLIPGFGFVWQFFVVGRIGTSLRKEFDSLGILDPNEKPGYGVGLAMCILICCFVIPFLNFAAMPAAFVLWIIYWVKIAGFKKRLVSITGQEELTKAS